jgi:hypothetical protein
MSQLQKVLQARRRKSQSLAKGAVQSDWAGRAQRSHSASDSVAPEEEAGRGNWRVGDQVFGGSGAMIVLCRVVGVDARVVVLHPPIPTFLM